MGCVLSVLLNVFFNALFIFVLDWGVFSIALATSLSAFVNCFFLTYHLKKRCPALLFDADVSLCLFKTAASTLAAGGVTVLLGYFLIRDPSLNILLYGQERVYFSREFKEQLLQFIGLSSTFFLFLFSYAWMFNAEEILSVFRRKEIGQDVKKVG